MLKDKKQVIEEIGMKFDEAIELFSDETLESMIMVNIVGGDTQTYCSGAQCIAGCNNNCYGCGSSSGSSGGNNNGGSSGGNNNGGSSNNIGDSGSTHVGNNSSGNNNGTSVPIQIYFTVLCGIQGFC